MSEKPEHYDLFQKAIDEIMAERAKPLIELAKKLEALDVELPGAHE